MNALVEVRFTIDVPDEKLAQLVGRPDDGSDAWCEESDAAAERYVREDLPNALERHAITEPDVECIA